MRTVRGIALIAMLGLACLFAMMAPALARCRDAELADLKSSAQFMQREVSQPDAQLRMADDISAGYASCARGESDPTERAKLMLSAARVLGEGMIIDVHRGDFPAALRVSVRRGGLADEAIAIPGVDSYVLAELRDFRGFIARDITALKNGVNPLEQPAP